MTTRKKFNLTCERCGGNHEIEIETDKITPAQIQGKEPVLFNYVCPDMALMYRVMGYAFDFTVNSVKDTSPRNEIINRLKAKWGEENFDKKLERYVKLNVAYMGVPDEYHQLLQQIVNTYCCGNFYTAMTGAGVLGERILNRLILKTRNHFKSSPLYKKVYRKDSFDTWELPIEALKEWGVISQDVADLFLELKTYRNDSIHYNEYYDFETNSFKAVVLVAEIIKKQLDYINRKDLCWVFDIPGEIWLRSSVLSNPFVIEFVLPHCVPLTPFCEPFADPPIAGKNVPKKPLTDEEFIEIRKSKKN